MEDTMTIGYHHGQRRLQDEFESRKIADRLDDLARTAFTEDDKAFIEACPFFHIATADDQGRPDCSHKGGVPGFVQVSAPDEISFPDYDGNGMFKSLGNIAVNPNVGLLFIDFQKPRRLRVNGTASFSRNDPLLACTVGVQLIVRVKARAIFPNCPRYIPTMQFIAPSKFAPRAGAEFLEPEWKSFPEFAPIIPSRQRTFRG
jgi:predicted pyridoxine 5'-phosphate oxidase superfamily flavin-nucleotide-binding protein